MTKLPYRPEIDGLRAIAVLSVIFHHAGLLGFDGGFIGVDVFFVISGFLITSLLLNDHQNDRFSILKFYERRARRIIPALSLVLVSSALISLYVMTPSQIQNLGQSLIAVSLFASNILFWRSGDYFDPISDQYPLLHTWSLGVEEQFYIIFPLLLIFIWRFAKSKIFWIFLFGAVASLALAEWGWRHKPTANFYLLPTRAWELLVGAMLALPTSQTFLRKNIHPTWRGFLAGMGLLSVLMPICLFNKSTPFPSLYALLPTLGAALLIAFANKDNYVGRFLSLKTMVGIGLISYSAYLWHHPLFAYARIITLDHATPTMFAGLIATTLCLAFLTWKYIEKPFRQKNRFTQKQIFISSLITSLTIITIGLVMYTRHDPLAQAFRPNGGLSAQCDATGLFKPRQTCVNDPAPSILVWGDSLAMHLVQGFLADKTDLKLAQATKSSCGPFLNIGPLSVQKRLNEVNAAECIAFNDSVFTYLKKQGSIKTVILSSLMEQYLSDGRVFTRSGTETASMHDLANKIGATIRAIRQIGKKVIIFAPPPITNRDPAACQERHMLNLPIATSNNSCHIDRATYQTQRYKTIRFLKALEAMHDVKVFWFDYHLCDHAICYTGAKDLPFYRDRTHFSYEGSRYLGKKLGFFKMIVDNAR